MSNQRNVTANLTSNGTLHILKQWVLFSTWKVQKRSNCTYKKVSSFYIKGGGERIKDTKTKQYLCVEENNKEGNHINWMYGIFVGTFRKWSEPNPTMLFDNLQYPKGTTQGFD